MNTYSLVLAGGGGKGAYQIGAWAALKEIGVSFDAIAGTSIGSINGALIAAGDYEKAHRLWKNISIDKGIKITEELPDSENLFGRKNWGVLFKEVLKNGGLDASPTADFISQYIDEKAVRSSGIPFYIVTVQMTQGVTPREIAIEEIPDGELIDYLMASSNIPLATGIGPEGEKFLDGGVYDNIPLMTLKKRGYNKLIVIDISNIRGIAHSMNIFNSDVVYIKPYDTDMLGGFMDLDVLTMERREKLGYLDTKKAFSLLSGNIYYFSPNVFKAMVKKYGADTLLNLEQFAFHLKLEPCKIYTEESFISELKLLYEEEKNRGNEEEKPQTETAEKESEIDILKNVIMKRFNQRRNIDEFSQAVNILDAVNIL